MIKFFSVHARICKIFDRISFSIYLVILSFWNILIKRKKIQVKIAFACHEKIRALRLVIRLVIKEFPFLFIW